MLFGAYLTFKTFLLFGLSSALLFTFLYIFFGLFMILALDAFSVNKKRLEEAKKQTKLLEKIAEKLQKSNDDQSFLKAFLDKISQLDIIIYYKE